MNSEEMYASLNKGVPNSLILDIDIKELLYTCASNTDLLKEELTSINQNFQNSIESTIGRNKKNNNFYQELRVVTNNHNSYTGIFVSPVPFLKQLKEILGVKNDSLDFNDGELGKELINKVNELKKITSSEKLKIKFPLIYDDYIQSKACYAEIAQLQKLSFACDIQEEIDQRYAYMDRYALNSIFKVFINKQVSMYQRMCAKRAFIEGNCNRNPLDLNNFDGLDKDKFEFYLAYLYLKKAYTTKDITEKQEALYYVATYIRETKPPYQIMNIRDERFTFRKLVIRYSNLLKKYDELKPVDMDRDRFRLCKQETVNKIVSKYLGNKVTWEIVPSGTSQEEKQLVKIALEKQYKPLLPEDQEKVIAEKYALYEQKFEFFENSNYLHKIKGQDEFGGYVAYVYENGEILLERFYTNRLEYLPATNEAIYNINAINFETLTKLPKTILMKDEECKRIIHAGAWQTKCQTIINIPATEETKENVKKLVLKHQTI